MKCLVSPPCRLRDSSRSSLRGPWRALSGPEGEWSFHVVSTITYSKSPRSGSAPGAPGPTFPHGTLLRTRRRRGGRARWNCTRNPVTPSGGRPPERGGDTRKIAKQSPDCLQYTVWLLHPRTYSTLLIMLQECVGYATVEKKRKRDNYLS